MKSKRSHGVSIVDVAKAAKVSTATVSYVVNNRGGVSEETALRVRRAIAELDYHPNAAGQSLATHAAHAMGLLAPSATGVSDPFFTMFLAGVLEATRGAHYQLVLLSPESTVSDTEAAILRAVRTKRIDGVILLEVEPDDHRARRMVEEGVPTVLFGRSTLDLAWVDIDNHQGGLLATQHLLDLGHRRIAHIAAPDRFQYARLRRQGYQAALEAYGGLVAQVAEGDLTRQAGYDLARQLLTNGAPPTAIFVASDVMAEGVLQCAAQLGVRVPDQLSVVGFDDSPLAQDTFPPLTTVSQNGYQVGQRVATLLIDYLAERTLAQELVKPELRIRQTTAAVNSELQQPAIGAGIMLKRGPSFAWLSLQGTVDPVARTQGVYMQDTHWLNLYQVLVDGRPLTPARTSVQPDTVTMDFILQQGMSTRHLTRELRLREDGLEDDWHWRCYGPCPPWTLDFHIAPDFRDIFEIRGMATQQHDAIESVYLEEETHRYRGRDGVDRELAVHTRPPATEGGVGQRRWRIGAEQRRGQIGIRLGWRQSPATSALTPTGHQPRGLDWPRVEIGDPLYQRVLERARSDIDMLLTDFGQGPIPAAGLPWYGTFFGRDGILSAYQLLEFAPVVAERTLANLVSLQGRDLVPEREEMPGKMVHEVRYGELANIGVVPYGRYYGSVDVTPLFLILLEATWRRTGDPDLIERYMPAAEKGLAWMEAASRQTGDGLYAFYPSGPGLLVQSWKDSSDSMVYGDGRQAHPPLAVAEVQGYVYAAKLAMAELYAYVGNEGARQRLLAETATLQARFQRAFWMADREYYAMAVDGEGKPLDVLSSDPGQCLWTGIIPPAFRPQLIERLLSPELFTGWGIRTLAEREVAYDPFSYHRGSVWPHDTALIVAGLARSGAAEAAWKVASGLLDAAARLPHHRLPELFSGMPRQGDGAPLPYPSACAPQAWAAGAPWLILQSLLGLHVDARQRSIMLSPVPQLPWKISVRGLQVPGGTVSVEADGSSVRVVELPAGWTASATRPTREVVQRSRPDLHHGTHTFHSS